LYRIHIVFILIKSIMPFIESKDVASIRKQIKDSLPAFKVSVKRQNYSKVDVSILSGPVDFGTTYQSLNPYNLKEAFQGNHEASDVLLKIDSIIDSFDGGTLHDDGDYGNVPEFYRGVSVGEWDKPYVLTLKN